MIPVENSAQNNQCPVCLEAEVVEHIEVAPVEDRVKGPDRRRSVDLVFLSLIADDRRKIDRDRRGIDVSNLIVKHHGATRLVCLKCEHEWSANDAGVDL